MRKLSQLGYLKDINLAYNNGIFSLLEVLIYSYFPFSTLIIRMEKITAKSRSSQAKVLGTIVSISSAFVVTLYKGPTIISAHKPSFSFHQFLHIPSSVDPSWAIGGLLLTAEYILVPL